MKEYFEFAADVLLGLTLTVALAVSVMFAIGFGIQGDVVATVVWLVSSTAAAVCMFVWMIRE